MFILISILLYSNLFIQISTSEETSQPFYTKKIDNDNNVWICFREDQANITDGLNDQSPERLVVYLYKNPVTQEIKAFVPGPDKQALIPNFPASLSNKLKPVTTEHISSLFNSQPEAPIVSTKGDPIGLNQGKIKTINFKPVNTERFSKQLALQNQNVPPVDLPSWTYNDKPQYYPAQQVPQNLYPQLYLQEGYPTYAFNLGPDQTQEIYLYDDIEYTTESDAHIKYDLPNKTQDIYTETIQLSTAPESIQAGSPSVKPELFSPGSAIKHLTFDQWFTKQMITFQDVNLPDDVKAIDSDLLRSLVQKTLFENQLNVTSTGLITDGNGIPINVQNLELRPILIGNSINYQSLQGNQQIPLPQPLPYLEGILVTLVFPPKILGIIPIGKTYVSKPSPVKPQAKVTKVNTPALIKRYYSDLGSSPAKSSNPSSVTVSPYINHWSFANPVRSSPKSNQKTSSALNPFGVTGSLSSSINLPFLPNSPLFSKRPRPELSGAWLRRSNGPKKSEKLKNESEKLIGKAKKLVIEATKLEHDAKTLEKEAKKGAKKLEHEAQKLEKEAKKEAKKLKKEAKKLKKQAEKSKVKKEPKYNPLSGTKPPLEPKPQSGPHTPSGAKPPSEPKLLAGPKPPSKSKPKKRFGPETELGPHPHSEPKTPTGPKPLSESRPHPPSGPKPKSEPHSPPRPKPESGLQPPSDPKPELRPHPPSGPKSPLEPKSPPGPNSESGPNPLLGPKQELELHPPSGPKPNSELKPQSKPKIEPEKSYRRLGSQDLPPYNLDWNHYLNHKNSITSQGFGFLPASKLKDVWAKSSSGSNTPAEPKSDKLNDASVYRRVIYPDTHHKFDNNAYGYLTANPYYGEWNFPPKPVNNHPQLVGAPTDNKWNLQDPDTPQMNFRPLDDNQKDAHMIIPPFNSKWNSDSKINNKSPKWGDHQNDGSISTQDNSYPHLIATPFNSKWNSDSNINNKSPKWGDHQNDASTFTQDSNYPHLIASPFNSKWHTDSKINNKSPKWGDHQNDGGTSTQDNSSPHLIATPYNSKWNSDSIINNKSPKWGDPQNDGSISTQDNSYPHLIATPFNSKWNSDSNINNKSPKWGDNQNDGSTSTQDNSFPHLIATPFNSKWHVDSKINNKSPKWGDHQNDGSTSTLDSSSPHLIASPFNSKWHADSKIKNKSPKWGDLQNDGSSSTQDNSYPHLIASPYNSKWNSKYKINNKSPKWGDHQNDGSTSTQDNSYPHLIASPYNKWHSDSKINNKSPKWGEIQNYNKFKYYPTQYTDAPKLEPNSQWTAFIAADKKSPNSYNTVPERNIYSRQSINPDLINRSGLGSPFWHPSTTPRSNTRRPKSPVINARRTYDQISAEIGTEESIEDFQDDNPEKLQHEVEETPSRRSDSPVQGVLKSLLKMVLKNVMNEITGGGGNRRKAEEPIDINATATNPIQIEGTEDDHRDFRIIGGSAATGSGSPLSNKGRSGINFSFK